jgi:predicted acyl esterase
MGAARRRNTRRRRGEPGDRTLIAFGAGLNRPGPSAIDPPDSLTWTTALLDVEMTIIGEIELRLDAIASAADTAWIVLLRAVSPTAAPTTSRLAIFAPAFAV